MVNFFFAGWEPILRVLVVGTTAYLVLVVILRASGKRTLARMNSFDFVITVAIGATFGRVLTARSVPLVEAVTAFTLLVVLQYLVTSLQLRSSRFSGWVTAEPTLLYFRGRLLHDAMRKERFTEDEMHGAVRKHGFGSLQQVTAVVVESNGQLSVIGTEDTGDGDELRRIAGR